MDKGVEDKDIRVKAFKYCIDGRSMYLIEHSDGMAFIGVWVSYISRR